MYPPEKLLGLAIIAGIIGVVASGYLLAWRSNRAASRRVGSLVVAAIAGLVGLFGVWWAIGAVSPIPPPERMPPWGVAIALLLLLPIPLGALYISARFFRRALRDEHGKD
jgi:low temperature requirement protein LtrA